MDVAGFIAGVTGRTLNGGKVIYDVQANLDGIGGITLSTFDGDIAKRAQGFAASQQRVSVRYEEKPAKDPKYPPNRYINDVAPEGQLGAAGAAQAVDGIPIAPAGQPRGGRGGGGGMSTEDKVRISKLAGLHHGSIIAGALFQGLGPEFEEQALALAERVAMRHYKLAWGQAVPTPGAQVAQQQDAAAEAPQTEPIVPTATTPEAVAAGVPGVAVGTGAVDQQPSAADLAWN